MTGVYVVIGSPFIYIDESETLVMADLHFGFEEAASRGLIYSLRKSSGYYAVFIPRIQFKKTISLLDKVLSELRVKRVLVNGDLKHAFDRLLKQEKEEVISLIKYLREKGVEDIIVVRGNHDNFIKPILRKMNVDFVNSISIPIEDKRVLFTHGHEEVDLSGHDVVVIGHEHPSLKCFEVYRFPCFMKIPWNNKTIVVMPATGPYHPGVVVAPFPTEYLSPIIRRMESLKSASIITWLDLGEISSQSIEYFESVELSNYIEVERHIIDNREYGVIEFKNYNAVQLLCNM
jgi:Predicted ICC-like phosphoesterases